jgi:hypothetical protein
VKEENNQYYKVVFTDEFDLCLDRIQEFFAVHESDRTVDVINILPSRTKRKRVKK